MRRFLLVILTAVSMLVCCSCSCSSSVSLKNPSESGAYQDENSERSLKEVYLEHKKAAAEAWEECDKSEMQTFTGEDGGIAFTVSTDKREYVVGEPVRVKAAVQNVSGEELYNEYNYLVECYPLEILADITCGGSPLYSKRYKEIINAATFDVPMEPGEIYDDYMTFETSYRGKPAEPGEYKGTCYIYTVPDPDRYDERTKHSIDFSITLKQSGQTP